MADVDTSSYPKPQQSNFLDTAGKFQQLEAGQLSIDQNKLKLANDRLATLGKAIGALIANPDVTGDNADPTKANNLIKQQAAAMTNLLGIPKEFSDKFVAQNFPIANSIPEIKTRLNQALSHAQSTQEMINLHYGIPGALDTGQGIQPIVSSPIMGMRATGLPIQKQIPPTQQVVTPEGPQLQGPTPAQAAPGMATMPPVAPGFRLPVRQNNNVGPGGTPVPLPYEASRNNDLLPTPAQVVQNRYPSPSGPATGYSPLFDEGKSLLTKDQQQASSRMMAAKPALQALKLMDSPGFLSGPGSEQFTQAVAALKTFGLITTANENDPTAIRQEVAKKLAQYVSGSPIASRSDAAQTLAEASSPNPKTQILPALIKLTKDSVILDRVQAAMPNAFKDKDLSKYGSFKAIFPQSIDERAFGLDMEKDSSKLVDAMAKKLNSKNVKDRNEATKFFNSLKIAEQQGFYQ